jgi:hypothetical protein
MKLKHSLPLLIVATAMITFMAVADEDVYSEAIKKEWAKLVARYNTEMTNPDKAIGLSLSDGMAMSPTMSHKRAAWYYGRVNFLLGKYSVNPTKEREKAVLDSIAEFLSKYDSATNSSGVKQ